MTDEAIILVGGLGTRLRAMVSDVPKPLAPVGGRPFLAWMLDMLDHRGLSRIVLAAGYRADAVKEAIGTKWGRMSIEYSIETAPLGTGGAIRRACQRIHGRGVHVLNGDTFLQYDPAALERCVQSTGCQIGMAVASVTDTARYGAVVLDGQIVSGFTEKGVRRPGYINGGAYFLTREAMARLPAKAAYSFEDAVLLPAVEMAQACGYTETSAFIDIGVPEDYVRAQGMFGGETRI